MKSLRIKKLDLEVGQTAIVVLHKKDADDLSVHASDRIRLQFGNKSAIAIVDVTETFIEPGQIGVFKSLKKNVDLRPGKQVIVQPTSRPVAVNFIRKKMNGEKLSEKEIRSIIENVVNNGLSQVELSAFISSVYIRGLATDEIVALTKSIVECGNTLDLGKHPVIDKHCIGGIAGNRTTPIVVPILAAAGVYCPKTSSRAITSPAGTADTMEALANVVFNIDEMREIVTKAKGCIVWGGGVNLAAADDKLIKVRYPLNIDPEPLLLASILAKKKAVGAEKVLIDIPVGSGAKIKEGKRAKELANNFIRIGTKIDIDVDCALTPGDRPIGRGVGPILEAIDVMDVLNNQGPQDLRHKSLALSGLLLEMSGKAKKGTGVKLAEKILTNGKALKKMNQIIELQGGNPKDLNLTPGQYTTTIKATFNGRVFDIDNHAIGRIARAAGAPADKGAGIVLHVGRGQTVNVNDPLIEIYAEQERKLDDALGILELHNPIIIERMVLDYIGEGTDFDKYL